MNSSSTAAPSLAPVSDSLIDQVVYRARKFFVSGYVANINAIREAVKHDIKKEIMKTYQGEFTPEHEKIFEQIYSQRVLFKSFQPEAKSEKHILYWGEAMTHGWRAKVEHQINEEFAQMSVQGMEKLRQEYSQQYGASPANIRRQQIYQYYTNNRYNRIKAEQEQQDVDGLPPAYQEKLKQLIKNRIEENNCKRDRRLERSCDEDQDSDSDASGNIKQQCGVKIRIDHFSDTYKAQLKNELMAELAQPELSTFKERKVNDNNKFYLYEDPLFPDYGAHRIAGSNFIAAAGPMKFNAGCFFDRLFFQDGLKESKVQVEKIIGLGSCGPVQHDKGTGFYNYSFDERWAERQPNEPMKKFDLKMGEEKLSVELTNKFVSPDYYEGAERGFVYSHLSLKTDKGKEKEVDALLIGLPDNDSLDLEGEEGGTEKLMELLWQASRTALTQAVVVHCMGGIGRTGHLILTLELLMDYKNIFAGGNADEIYARIDKVVERLRQNRVPLVAVREQMSAAIYNAQAIYQYAYKKKYIVEEGCVSGLGFMTPVQGAKVASEGLAISAEPSLSGLTVQ